VRTSRVFSIKHHKKVKEQLLSWGRKFQEIAWLDSNDNDSKTGEYEAILAVEAFTAIKTDHVNAFDKLKEYQETTADWIFGYLSYDLKNDVERLKSSNHDGLHFPDLYFFQPQKLIFIKNDQIEFRYLRMIDDEIEEDFEIIRNFKVELVEEQSTVKVEARISKEQYLEKISKMLHHIHRGDIYEANFCQEFYSEDVEIDPFSIYRSLNEISTPPFHPENYH